MANIPFLSKVIEKVAATQAYNYLETYKLISTMQSAYRKNHSTEATLLCMTNDVLRTINRRQDVVLVLLDLSAAFDIGLWPCDPGGKTRVLPWFLKTDAELVQIIPWKPPSINKCWRSSDHSSRSALWFPTRFYTWTPTFHPVYCLSEGCDCSP